MCEHGYIGACPEGCDVPQPDREEWSDARSDAEQWDGFNPDCPGHLSFNNCPTCSRPLVNTPDNDDLLAALVAWYEWPPEKPIAFLADAKPDYREVIIGLRRVLEQFVASRAGREVPADA